MNSMSIKQVLVTYPKLAHALAIIENSCRDGRRSGFSEEQCFVHAYTEALQDSGLIDWGHRTEILLYEHELLTGTAQMPEGHNSRQESASQGETVSPTIPRPRLSHESATPQATSSQRFLNRFSAGDSLKAAPPLPRAMKNRFSTSFLHPPAVNPSPKAAGAFNSKAVK